MRCVRLFTWLALRPIRRQARALVLTQVLKRSAANLRNNTQISRFMSPPRFLQSGLVIVSPPIPRKALKYWFHSVFIAFFCGVHYGKVRALKINIPLQGEEFRCQA